MSTSLNLNCSSAPPVSVWSTCVALANAVITHKTVHGSLVLGSHLDATALLAACDSAEADKLFSASTRSAFSASNDVVNSATSAFAFVKSPRCVVQAGPQETAGTTRNCEQRLTRRGECRRARSNKPLSTSTMLDLWLGMPQPLERTTRRRCWEDCWRRCSCGNWRCVNNCGCWSHILDNGRGMFIRDRGCGRHILHNGSGWYLLHNNRRILQDGCRDEHLDVRILRPEAL